MSAVIRQLIYFPLWYLRSYIFKKHVPLQTVLFITDACNLRCKHCAAANHEGKSSKSYEDVCRELDFSLKQGARFVDFEGGEPTLWRDGAYTVNDLIRYAKKIGFFTTTVTTNGQLPIKGLQADLVWVSVDGFESVHDLIRGNGTFEKLKQTIRESGHPNVNINMAINRLNRDSVADTIRFAKENPQIKSISLNFHTPFPGTEALMLPWGERLRVIDEILTFKRQGYPILNSRSGLVKMKSREFKRDCWVSSFILTDGTRLKECPGKAVDICRDCGFCMAGEMHGVLRLRPDTILSALRLRL